MATQVRQIETTLEQLRQRARRLEQEAVALQSDISLMSVWASWGTQHRLSVDVLRDIPITDAELLAYQGLLNRQFPDDLLRLVLKAHKAAHWLIQSIGQMEQAAAVESVLTALHELASEQGLTIPDELEAVIGD